MHFTFHTKLPEGRFHGKRVDIQGVVAFNPVAIKKIRDCMSCPLYVVCMGQEAVSFIPMNQSLCFSCTICGKQAMTARDHLTVAFFHQALLCNDPYATKVVYSLCPECARPDADLHRVTRDFVRGNSSVLGYAVTERIGRCVGLVLTNFIVSTSLYIVRDFASRL